MKSSMFQGVRFRFLVLSTLCALAVASFAAAADRALIVGIGEFSDSRMNLIGIDLDVDLMQQTADYLGFRDVKTLRDGEATLQGFKKVFEEWLIDGTRAGDRVLVYFSSHGTRVPDDNGDEKDDGQDEVLVMHDTRAQDGQLTAFLRDDEFSTLLRRLTGRDVLVLVDACNSGTAYKQVIMPEHDVLQLITTSLGEHDAYAKFLYYPGMPGASSRVETSVVDKNVGVEVHRRPDNFAFISAAADNEFALATKKGSVFTLGLNHVIKKAASEQQAASEQEPLTMLTLKDKVERYIKDKITSGNMGPVHHPQLGGNPDLLSKPLRLVVPTRGGRTWQQLAGLAERGTPLTIAANREAYRLGDKVVFTINVERAGYLNVVNVGPDDSATVLFPNQYHRDNHVQPGTLILPTDQMPFYFPATKPTGETLTVAFLTARQIDLFEEAVEGRDKTGAFEAILVPLSASGTRNVGVASQDAGYAAGKVLFKVE